jgi:uncharacterized LabA/DUF88 family protein
MKEGKNYAFIDSQNLNLGIKELGWNLDFRKFRVYLIEKFGAMKTYLFIGYVPENKLIYSNLRKAGYSIIFKPIVFVGRGIKIKGNVDAELVLQAMIDYNNYDKAIIVSGDGDFGCLARYLLAQNKLQTVICPSREKSSVLIRQAAKERIIFLDNSKNKLEYKKSTA